MKVQSSEAKLAEPTFNTSKPREDGGEEVDGDATMVDVVEVELGAGMDEAVGELGAAAVVAADAFCVEDRGGLLLPVPAMAPAPAPAATSMPLFGTVLTFEGGIGVGAVGFVGVAAVPCARMGR